MTEPQKEKPHPRFALTSLDDFVVHENDETEEAKELGCGCETKRQQPNSSETKDA